MKTTNIKEKENIEKKIIYILFYLKV